MLSSECRFSKRSSGMIGQMRKQSSATWWAKASVPLSVELRQATPPPGPRPPSWQRQR